MMDAITIAVTGLLCLICFITGAKIGQKVSRGEEIETPTINPIQAVKEHRERKEAEYEQNRIDTIMRNIEVYDGTSKAQEDVPGK